MIRKKIKVPLDGSKNSLRGLDNAISIARACQATITGIYILPVYPRNLADAVIPYFVHPEREAKKFMADAKLRAAKKGIVFKSKGAIKEIFLGSVSNAIVHKSKIPVMVVK